MWPALKDLGTKLGSYFEKSQKSDNISGIKQMFQTTGKIQRKKRLHTAQSHSTFRSTPHNSNTNYAFARNEQMSKTMFNTGDDINERLEAVEESKQ